MQDMELLGQLRAESKPKKSHTGLVIVLILGFLLALGLGLFIFYEFYWKKKEKTKESYNERSKYSFNERSKYGFNKGTNTLNTKIRLHSVNYDYVPNTQESRPQLFVETYNGDIPDDIHLFSNVMLNLTLKPTPYPPKSEKEYAYISNRLNSSSYHVKDISGPYIILESDTFDSTSSIWGYTVDGFLLY